MTTRRENLLKVFKHQVPEWIPIVGHVDKYNQPNRSGMDKALVESLEGKESWGPTGTVDFSRYFGVDIMDRVGSPLLSKNNKVAFHQEWKGDVLHSWWETPYGEIHERKKRIGKAPIVSMAPVEYPVKTVKDFKVLRAVFEYAQFEIDHVGTASLEERIRLVGDDGIVVVGIPGTPFGELVQRYMGLETSAYIYADYPNELLDLLAVIEDNYLRQLRLLVSLNINGFLSNDNTSTTAISPGMFRDLEMPYINNAAAIAHASDKFYIHHSCGHIRDLLGYYANTDMDAVDSLNIPPTGNVSIAEAKKRLGCNIVIIATMVYLFGSLDDKKAVRQSIRQMFKEAAPGDNFVILLAPDPANTMDDIQFVLDEARKYQKLSCL